MRTALDCEVISCNRPLPSDAFAVRFPDWLRVLDEHDGKIYVWGPEGKPRLTFATKGEYQEWWMPRLAKAEGMVGTRSRLTWPVLVGVNLVVVVAIVFALVRRRYRVLAR
jgi:hypothetical protein